MQEKDYKKGKTPFGGLFGEPTPAKASGLVFSVATVLPTVLSFIFLLILAFCGKAETDGYQNQDWYLYANYLLPQISFALVAYFYLRYRQIPLKNALFSQKCKPKYFLIAFFLQIGLFGLSELNSIFLNWLGKFGYNDAGISLPSVEGFGFVGVFLVIGVLAPVLEEIVFRGMLLNGLKKTFSMPVAVVLCGALFALFHQNPAQTVYQFCCGTAFALVAIKSGSVLPTVLSHFLNNAFVLILYKAGVAQFSSGVLILLLCLSAVCLTGVIGYLIFKDKQESTVKTSEDKKSGKNKFFVFASVGIALCALTWLIVLCAGM
ncbi:MAG: CPBP family intramembrane metalloprotease [Clostridiales bacterium]|nr:CPBP family intramembrane metalloprotease [Clostridiales bacterium]